MYHSTERRRRVFYSFHYKQDNWRTQTVRNIGSVEGSTPVHTNKWEEIKQQGHDAIKRWIKNQLDGRTCTIVLVGSWTASREWVQYEIKESWQRGMGVVGIHIHDLLNQEKQPSQKGQNPFAKMRVNGQSLAQIVECHDPTQHVDYSLENTAIETLVGYNSQTRSQRVYGWIHDHLSEVIEDAIEIRDRYR